MNDPRVPDAAAPTEFPPELLQRAAGVRLACFDVDGVLTDGRLWYGADGEALKAFHVHDGLGLRMLMAAGIEVAVVTARSSAAVAARMADLGVTRVHQGVSDKLACVAALAAAIGCDLTAVAFTGDDEPDAAAMRTVGVAIAVANARPSIHSLAHWSTRAAGGVGAVREVCELLLSARTSGTAATPGDDGRRA